MERVEYNPSEVIHINDAALHKAVSESLGIRENYTAGDLATIKGLLTISGARDMLPLSYCTSLTELTLIGSEISSLDCILGLKNLNSLHIIASTLSNIDRIDALESLVNLSIQFTFVEQINSIWNLPKLRLCRLHGNPILPEDYEKLYNYNLDYPVHSDNLGERAEPIFDISNKEDWSFTRRLFESGERACFSRIDWRSLLVLPRISKFDSFDSDFVSIWTSTALEYFIFHEGYTAAQLIENCRGKVQADDAGKNIPYKPRYHLGNWQDAVSWIEKSSLSHEDKRFIRQFIYRFRNKVFFYEERESLNDWQAEFKVKLPEWLVYLRSIFSFILPYYNVEVQFGLKDEQAEELILEDAKWYDFDLDGISFEDNKLIQAGEYQLFNICMDSENEVFLAINLASDTDSNVYQYYAESYIGEASIHPDGLYLAYSSYAKMLSHIYQIKIYDTDVIVSKWNNK